MKPARFMAVALLLVFSSIAQGAETRYVSDRLVVSVRPQRGEDQKPVAYIATGDHVEVLDESGEYYRVRTKDGVEGWVLKQYVTSEKPKSEIIESLESEVDRLTQKADSLEAERNSLRKDLNQAKREISAKSEELEKAGVELRETSDKYDDLMGQSRDVAMLADERELFKQENERLSGALELVRKENESLRRKGIIQWFLAGGGVFLAGWLVGKVSRKKRYY